MSIARGIMGLGFVVFVLPLGVVRGQEPSSRFPPPEATPTPAALPEIQHPTAAAPEAAPAAPPKNDVGGFGGFGGPGMGGGPGGPGYTATWYPSRPVSGTGDDLGLVRQNLSLGAPLWRDGGDALLLTAGLRYSRFFTDAVLPDTRRPFPGELWNASLGLNATHRFDNGWAGGLMTGVGSASDRPFHSVQEMNVMVAAFLRVPARNERDSWVFSLFYSSAGNLNFPIPGVAYAWNPSDDLRVNVGLPFSVYWRPAEDLTLNLSYVPLTNINARATYRLTEVVSLYGAYEFLNESYFLADRAESRDRFMGFEQRLTGGIRWDVGRHAVLDVNAGYAFDRFYGEGRNQGGDLHDRVDLAPGAFLGANLRVRF